MASATMGLRRRVPVNNTTTQSSHHSQSSSTAPPSGNKRSRSENNNNPSHGNLNSLNDTPPTAKKSRGTSALSSNRANNQHHIMDSGPSNKRTSSKGRVKSPQTSLVTPVATSTTSMTLRDTNMNANFNVLANSPWSVTTSIPETVSYAAMSGLGVSASGQSSLCNASLAMPPTIPYMATSMATFVGNATNLSKNSSVSYLDISNMTSGSLGNTNTSGINGYGTSVCNKTSGVTAAEVKTTMPIPFSGVVPTASTIAYNNTKSSPQNNDKNNGVHVTAVKFQNDTMFMAYQPWVIKTYGDLAKTKTITVKKYARILRTLRGEEANSAENSKFRFWVKSKGFHIGQPEGYDAKPADRIIGRHAVTNPGLDPPLYVPTQLPHNKALNGAEGTVTPGRVFKKVAIVENFFDIIHAVHVDLEGRPGKHAGQKRTYRTITETYAFLPREAVTRFLLGCTECQRRPRTPSPTNLTNQSHCVAVTSSNASATMTPSPLSPMPATAISTVSSIQNNLRPREASNPPESKSLFNYRHQKQSRSISNISAGAIEKVDKNKDIDIKTKDKKREREREREREKEREREREKEKEKEREKEKEKEKEKERDREREREKEREKEKAKEKVKEEKYNPLSISNLLKKEPPNNYTPTTENITESARRTPESDRASSRSSVSSKRKRMLPEGRTPSPPPTAPLPRPWSPGLDLKDTPVDYSLPITTTYLKHQQRILAEKNKAAAEAAAASAIASAISSPATTTATITSAFVDDQSKSPFYEQIDSSIDRNGFSPAAGLIDTNLNLLATIQHLHCQVMLALTERLRPTVIPTSFTLPSTMSYLPSGLINTDLSIPTAVAHNQS